MRTVGEGASYSHARHSVLNSPVWRLPNSTSPYLPHTHKPFTFSPLPSAVEELWGPFGTFVDFLKNSLSIAEYVAGAHMTSTAPTNVRGCTLPVKADAECASEAKCVERSLAQLITSGGSSE